MRFLFVYQDCVIQARRLLDDLQVSDVKIVVVRKNASVPTPEEAKMLEANKGAAAAACGVIRKYRKVAALLVNFVYEPKIFRYEDQQLREWLTPKNIAPITVLSPSAAFSVAASRSPRLVLHPNVAAFVGVLAAQRWEFATLGATLLARYADGESLGPLREWGTRYGIEFAANGKVSYKYRIAKGGEVNEGRTEWHLKQGDNTTPERAARIYFTRVELSVGVFVVVLYAGPHPADGEHSIFLTIP